LSIVDSTGDVLPFEGEGYDITRQLPGAVAWDAVSHAGHLTMLLHGQLEFDGNIEYTIAVTADTQVRLRDIRLVIPYHSDVARYFMGMNRKGGPAPDAYDWTWDVERNQDGVWIGDVNAGLQFTLSDNHYIRPLNTNFYQLRPLVMPESWENDGLGGCSFRAEDDAYRATCSSGAREMQPGDTLYYNVRLLITPFHPLDTRTHFTTRYFHRYAPIDSIRATGANIVNVHHATAVNPWINYPFLRPEAMKAYADSAHAAGMRMKIYYTVRELTYRAPELWALRSLGNEVLASGPGGGHSWLQEHIVEDYIPGWVVPEIRDVALVTSGISRWHNFYVEGLQWLVEHVGIDGLYLDDVAFDRTTMQRISRVLAPGPPGERIDLHSANQFNPNDGFASSANLYLEHFPYIDRLWFGEYFDYNSSPAYWLTEMSGIPFGVMGEMLQDGGNPWRGMVFGMTNRLPWAG
ncbi:MAG: glycoside hydrolase domain-containing protein, partial [Gemmatimonadales bacterium]